MGIRVLNGELLELIGWGIYRDISLGISDFIFFFREVKEVFESISFLVVSG